MRRLVAIVRAAALGAAFLLPHGTALAQSFLGNVQTDKLLGRDTPGTGPAEQLNLTGGLGFTGSKSITISDSELSCFAGLTSAADKFPYFTGAGTCALADLTAFARTILDDADAATVRSTLGVVIGINVQAWDADLDALATNITDGLWAHTGAGTGAARTLTAPAAGFTITNPAGIAGNPIFVLANDLGALEALGSTGIAVRSAADTWVQRAIAGTANQVAVTNGDGVAGNPTLSLPADVVIPTIVTAPNTGLHVLDTDATHDLIVKPGSNLTVDRTLTVTTGDADRTVTLNGDATLTGTNTGDQTITLTGDVTGSGTGSFPATIASDAVTFAKMQNIATDRLIGRDTALSGDPEEISLNATLEFTGVGAIQRAALTGDVAASAGSNATTIQADSVALTTDTTGNYVGTVADGTGIDGTAAGEGATYTPSLDLTEISSATWGAGAFTSLTFSGAGAIDLSLDFQTSNQMWVSQADAGATGPAIVLDHDSATPAASDVPGTILVQGEDSVGNDQSYSRIETNITDATSTSEDATIDFGVVTAGTLADELTLSGAAAYPTSDEGLNLGIDDSNRFATIYVGTGLDLDKTAELRFFEAEANGDNKLIFKAPASITADATCTLENDANPIPDSCVGDGVDGGGGSGDAVEIEQGDDTGVFDAIDTTARFEDQGDINFAFADGGAGGPDTVTASVRANSVALGPDTTGNFVDDVLAGTGLAVTHTAGEGSDVTVALNYSDAGADIGLAADECRFTSNATVAGYIVCEGDTADTIEMRIAVTDPTVSDKTFTIPNANSNPVQPLTCSGTNKVSAIGADGTITCTTDEGGAGDNATVNGVAVTDIDLDDADPAAVGAGVNVKWQLNTTPTPDSVSAYVQEASDTQRGAIEEATTAEADAGTDTDRAVTPAGLLAAVTGRQTIWITAGAMKARATSGASCGDTYDSGTNDVTIVVCNFDTTTQEFAHFQIAMPKNWNEGTLAFQPIWTNTAGLTTETVVFGLACSAISNDDTLNAAMGTVQTSTDTWLAQNDQHTGPESAAITCGGTPTEGDLVAFQLNRTVASDNLTGDAALIGVKIYYTTNDENDD